MLHKALPRNYVASLKVQRPARWSSLRALSLLLVTNKRLQLRLQIYWKLISEFFNFWGSAAPTFTQFK